MSFPWAHQLLWELLHQPSVYLSIYFCLQNVRLFAWGTRAPQSAFCAQRQSWAKELTAQPVYKQGERGEHSTSDAELRYGAEREQHLQEDNCFTEIKLLQKNTALHRHPTSAMLWAVHLCTNIHPKSDRKKIMYLHRDFCQILPFCSSCCWGEVKYLGKQCNRWCFVLGGLINSLVAFVKMKSLLFTVQEF